jgi:hypothetical protein
MSQVKIEQIADGGYLVTILDMQFDRKQYYFPTLNKLVKEIREYYTPEAEVTG